MVSSVIKLEHPLIIVVKIIATKLQSVGIYSLLVSIYLCALLAPSFYFSSLSLSRSFFYEPLSRFVSAIKRAVGRQVVLIKIRLLLHLKCTRCCTIMIQFQSFRRRSRGEGAHAYEYINILKF